MRKIIFSIVTLAATGVLAGQASASVNIGGTHSAAEIKQTCANVGGQFSQGDGGYGCINGNKGEVHCTNKGKCTGYTGSASRQIGTANTRATVGSVLSNPSGSSNGNTNASPGSDLRAKTLAVSPQSLVTSRTQGGAADAISSGSARGAGGSLSSSGSLSVGATRATLTKR